MQRWTLENIPRGSFHGCRCAVCVHFENCTLVKGNIAESNYCHWRGRRFERKRVLTVQDQIGQLQARMWACAKRPEKQKEFLDLNRQIAELARGLK